MSDPNALPIAGWYPDPEDDKGDRWWNGATWSDHRRPRNAGPGWAPSSARKKPAAKKAAEPAAVVAEPTAPAPSVPLPTAPAAASAIPGIAVPAAPGQMVNPYAASQPQPYAPAYAYNYVPAQPMRNPLALGGMITSLVGLLFNWILFGAPGIVGGIISIVGLRKANQLIREGVTVGNGKVMAITGIASGFAGAFLFDLFYFTTWSPLVFS
jgi:hypothetical protein